MKKISFIVEPCFDNNEIFGNELNRDHSLDPFITLRNHFLSHSVQFDTQSIIKPSLADLIIVLNHHEPNYISQLRPKKILMISECTNLLPPLNTSTYRRLFEIILTYQDDIINNTNIFGSKYSFSFPNMIDRDSDRKVLSCMIAGNKRCSHPGELYSERAKIIEWFEKNHPNDFDLFGTGWNRPHKMAVPWIKRKLLYRKPLNFFFINKLNNYCGTVDKKSLTMRNYKFAFTLENASNINGYITEKIFDAMFAGCVPIYDGAPNIKNYIPETCYIPFRKFKSISELHLYLRCMSEQEYHSYLESIENYIQSSQKDAFTIKEYVNSIGHQVFKLLDLPYTELA
jgi:alpha(1,3/1,4) fucosyltransferase